MGLIRALGSSVSGELANQYLEYFVCDSLSEDVLVTRGVKKSSNRSTNKGDADIINNGSGVVVSDGQCALIVAQGAIAEVCAEPGVYTYDASTESSVFSGGLGKGIIESFKQFGRRFSHGGEAPSDQRIYYVNIKEIMNNKFGTSNPLPFRVIDARTGIDFDISMRCFGTYTFKISDPVLFYKSISGNMTATYTRSQIADQLRSELLNGLIPTFTAVGAKGVRYSEIALHANEVRDEADASLADTWGKNRGITLVSLAFNSIDIPPEDLERIKEIQTTAVYTNQSMLGAKLALEQAEAMKAAASNTATGPMMAFAGLNMTGMARNNSDYSAMMANGQGIAPVTAASPSAANQNKAQNTDTPSDNQNAASKFAASAANQDNAAQNSAQASASNTWKCSCGAENTGKFCKECGQPKPAPVDGWECPSCKTINKGKFCTECGAKKPAGALLYKCDKCGWEPEDPKHPPKFCPECGDPFDESDVVK